MYTSHSSFFVRNFVRFGCCLYLFMPPRISCQNLQPTDDKNFMMGPGKCATVEEKILLLNRQTTVEIQMYTKAQWEYNVNRTKETKEEASKSIGYQLCQWFQPRTMIYRTGNDDVISEPKWNLSNRLFNHQKLLLHSFRNLTQAFAMKPEDLLPMLYIIHDHGVSKMDLKDFKTASTLKSKLKKAVKGVAVPIYWKTLRPRNLTSNEIKSTMARSSDPAELKYYWIAWHDQSSYEVKTLYKKYIGLMDFMAKKNNYSNELEYFMKSYVNDDNHLNYDLMYNHIKPLYSQLFTRVRKVLRDKFGPTVISQDGPIPVHLLGSVLGQPWTNLLPFMVPKIASEAIVQKCKSQTPKYFFDQAIGFYNSIGLGNVPKSVWSNSLFEESRRFADCKPSSWDMHTKNDFRIKMCYRDTLDDVTTMYKQLGLIHYFIEYKKQPIYFQHTPDTVFVDSMLNALTLSVQYRDFIQRFDDNPRTRRTYLLRMAMKKVSVLPFAYAAHVWHTNAFKETFEKRRMNDYWWTMRLRYEGLVSPILKSNDKRTDPNYRPFDPSASYNAMMTLPHIKYFLGPLMEFQIFKSLCTTCGEYDPNNPNNKHLYQCNLRGYKKIGKIIKSVMEKGSSTNWQTLFEMIVGHQRIGTEPLLEYFEPLHDHLIAINNYTGEYIGWKKK